jgi:hypothetical protein
MRHEHLPCHSARLVNEVVDVDPSLGGHHAALASPVQLTPITARPSPSTPTLQKACKTPRQTHLIETVSRSGC